jgi:hypothetical protein
MERSNGIFLSASEAISEYIDAMSENIFQKLQREDKMIYWF